MLPTHPFRSDVDKLDMGADRLNYYREQAVVANAVIIFSAKSPMQSHG